MTHIYAYTQIHTYIRINMYIHTHMYTHIYACLYIHIYTLIYMHIYIYIYIYIHMQISLNIIDILCLHIFFWIRSNSRITYIVFGGGLIYVLPIVVCIPGTFCPTLGHHQGRIYYKSDVTFVFPNYIVDEQIKRMIKNVNQQNKQCTTPSSQLTYIKLFYRNQMHYNYKSDEKILKTLIHKNILPTDPNKKIKLIIYYNKFNTSNLVIRNNSSPSIGVLQKTKVIYKSKCPLGDCISDNNYIYVGLT